MNRKPMLIILTILIALLNTSCSIMMYDKAKNDDFNNGIYVNVKSIDNIFVGDHLIIEGKEGVLCGRVIDIDLPDSIIIEVTYSKVDHILIKDVYKLDVNSSDLIYRYKKDMAMRLFAFYTDGVFIAILSLIYLAIASIGSL